MFELMSKGGVVMWAIGACAFLAATLFAMKLLELHRAHIRSADFLRGIFNILQRENLVEAISICEETPGPVARITRAAILHYGEDRAAIERAIEETGQVEIARLERNLPLLGTLANVTPLLGLLGTVLGMIRVLAAVEQKAPLVHAGDVLGGLWQALLTAAAGLAVAIPAYVGHNFLLGRVDTIVSDMERAANELLSFRPAPPKHLG